MTNDTENEEPQVSPVGSWKKKTTGGHVIELPSGNHARVKAPGLPTFLKMGFIPDNLVNIVKGAVEGKKQDEADIVGELISDQKRMSDLFDLYDRVVEFVFVEPRLEAPPEDEADRSSDIVYTDEVTFEDKAFVFNFAVGGTADLHRFRQQSTDAMERVRDREAVGSSAE